jgi:C1A family cysteine protease
MANVAKSRIGRRYNWKPDKPDHRDFKFALLAPNHGPNPNWVLAASVDLRAKCPPVLDQGDMGSCTANALAGGLGFLELQELQANNTIGAQVYSNSKGQYVPASRLMIYYGERSIEGDIGQDGGAELRDGIKSLCQWGVCRETMWPYQDSLLLKAPTAGCYAEGAKHKISSYYSLDTLLQVKQCLASGYPVAFGFTVYASFEDDSVAATGIMTMPTADDYIVGGHAVLAVGYDNKNQWLIVRNSWGPDWGAAGYFYMPYSYFTPDLTSDYWTIRK